jgi:hypothetical protein
MTFTKKWLLMSLIDFRTFKLFEKNGCEFTYQNIQVTNNGSVLTKIEKIVLYRQKGKSFY